MRVVRWLGWSVLAVAWLWALGALVYLPTWPGIMRALSAVVWCAVTVWHLGRTPLRWRAAGVIGGVTMVGLLLLTVSPTNDREWNPDQARLARAVFAGDEVTIENVRHATYRSETDFDVAWETRRYDLRQMRTVDFVVEPFSAWRGLAHVFLTFGFANGEHLAISVEIRKQPGESYSPLRGLYRHFEITYVIGDERDLIGLRANIRRDPVHLYPIRATPEQARALFVSMLDRANALAKRPEFYHSLLGTCGTSVLRHVNELRRDAIGLDWRILFPGFTDELAWRHGLIDFEGTLDEARPHFLINDRAVFDARLDGPAWSARIRRTSPTSPDGVESPPVAGLDASVRQLILAIAPGREASRGSLQCFERIADGGWREATAEMPALFGSRGIAWGRGVLGADQPGPAKTEGDGRAPAGVFAIGTVLGYAPTLPASADFPYHQVTARDAWVDDPKHVLYNQHVVLDDAEAAAPPAWFEEHRMRLNDPAYRWLIEVRHNADPPVPGAGSAIFLHVRRGETRRTAGCTALAEDDLLAIIRWLRVEAHPHFVLLAREDYERLWRAWGLPPP